ncbi:MAG TPA: ATP-binding protein [Acidimicrobiia bacterium]
MTESMTTPWHSTPPGPSVELRRLVAELAAWLSLGVAILVVIVGTVAGDEATLRRALSPLVVSLLGFYQLRTRRYKTGTILLAAAFLTVGQLALLGAGTHVQGAAVALVAIGLVWTLFLPRLRWWHIAGYSLLLVGAQAVWALGFDLEEVIGSGVGSVATFLGASLVVNHVQRAAGRSEERYRELFERSPVALWEEDFSEVAAELYALRATGATDLEQYLIERPQELQRLVAAIKVLNANETAAELLGASREELVGRLPSPQGDTARKSFTEQLLAVWEGREELEYEFLGEMRNGERRDLTLRWTVKSRGSLDYGHIIVAMSDITQRRQAERALQESRDRFERLAANAADAITRLRLHPEPVWEYASPAVQSMIGYSPDEFYEDGYIMRKITHPADRSRLAEFMKHPERWNEALTIRTIAKSGREVWAEMRMTPIFDETGELTHIETVTRDVTERKEYQTKLEELIRSKDEFVASVSHELRTPLTAVVGLAQELRDSRDRFGAEEVDELIDMIAGQATEVADIVNDLLVAARADIGMVSIYPESVDLAAEVASVLAAISDQDRGKVRVLGHTTVCVADPTRVRQIVRNLLTNAFRYGGSRVEVETAPRNGFATVQVRDDGEGVPSQDIDRVFDPYHRAHSAKTQPASVGLGLTVSRRLAQMMGGDVTYRKDGGFSVFELSLPRPGSTLG